MITINKHPTKNHALDTQALAAVANRSNIETLSSTSEGNAAPLRRPLWDKASSLVVGTTHHESSPTRENAGSFWLPTVPLVAITVYGQRFGWLLQLRLASQIGLLGFTV